MRYVIMKIDLAGPRNRGLAKLHGPLPQESGPTQREVFWRTSFVDRNLSSVSQAGLVNNLNDGMAWGLFPLFFAMRRRCSQV